MLYSELKTYLDQQAVRDTDEVVFLYGDERLTAGEVNIRTHHRGARGEKGVADFVEIRLEETK